MAEQLGDPVAFVPSQPALLVVGDRRIPIDEWPLARAVEERRSVEVSRPGDGVLVIGPKPRAGAGLVARSLLLLLGGALPGLVAAACEAPAWLSILLTLIAVALLALMVRGVLSGLRWVRLDRSAGELVIERRVGLRREHRAEHCCPLASIRAVQLLYSGRHSVTEPEGTGERQSVSYREYCGYELNLILDNPQVPRLNLVSVSDWDWVRRAGGQVGEFLGVPVLDRLYHGG